MDIDERIKIIKEFLEVHTDAIGRIKKGKLEIHFYKNTVSFSLSCFDVDGKLFYDKNK